MAADAMRHHLSAYSSWTMTSERELSVFQNVLVETLKKGNNLKEFLFVGFHVINYCMKGETAL